MFYGPKLFLDAAVREVSHRTRPPPSPPGQGRHSTCSLLVSGPATQGPLGSQLSLGARSHIVPEPRAPRGLCCLLAAATSWPSLLLRKDRARALLPPSGRALCWEGAAVVEGTGLRWAPPTGWGHTDGQEARGGS